MKKVALLLVAGALVFSSLTTAHAYAPFKKAFEAKYVKENPSTPEETMFKAEVEEAKCLICHKGKEKKNRNAYGAELAKLLDKGDQKDEKKINDALDEVAKMKNEDGVTYGDLIKEGKLPGGAPVKE